MPPSNSHPDADPSRNSPLSPFASGSILDLTHDLAEGIPSWPGDRPFALVPEFDGMLDESTYYFSNSLSMAEHIGTHMDAPRHMHREGRTVEQVPLERLIGPGVRIDVAPRLRDAPDGCATLDDLADWEKRSGPIPPGAIVLIHTGHSRHWNDPAAYMGTADQSDSGAGSLHFPGLASDAAHWLVESRAIRAVGVDTPGVDPGQSRDFATHKTLFRRGVPVFENLANLDRLPGRGFTVVALPLKLRGGSGAPLRVVAVLERNTLEPQGRNQGK